MFSKDDLTLLDDVTIVTAYTNIGSFYKGSRQKSYTTNLYYRWMRVFRYIRNPLVVFFDHTTDAKYFINLMGKQKSCQYVPTSTHDQQTDSGEYSDRSKARDDNFPDNSWKTKPREVNIAYFKNRSSSPDCEVNIFNRNNTWAFKLLPKIREILKRPGYPKHMPTTVVPEYQSIQHLKYEFVEDVAQRNPFRTKYFAWTDIGLFRHLVSQPQMSVKPFRIYLPPKFDPSKVAYNEVAPMINVTNKDIFYRNLYWVCGCFFIAERRIILQWTKEYKTFTEMFLMQGLANTDQRVIYAMQANENTRTRIQPYKPRNKYNKWFELAYLCKEEGSKRKI